jgi:E-phenylitaconyl-CoA hydratase
MGDILVEAQGHILIVTIQNQRKRNAVNRAMEQALLDALLGADNDPDARVVVITGAGDVAFCSGHDLGEVAGPGKSISPDPMGTPGRMRKPVIAAVNGHCLGYGLTLVTWCDFVIASDQAQFGFPEVHIGVPTIVGAIRLPQKIGWQYAMEILLTGDTISASRAHEIGLAGWVVPHDSLMSEARSLAARLVAAAPLAQRAVKEVAVRSQTLPMLEAIRFGETMRKVASATNDAHEGGRAMAEGRTPEWTAT